MLELTTLMCSPKSFKCHTVAGAREGGIGERSGSSFHGLYIVWSRQCLFVLPGRAAAAAVGMLLTPNQQSAVVSYSTKCPCLTSLANYGHTDDLIANVANKKYNYGPSYGLHECAAHDHGMRPYCNTDPPIWCKQQWCYVDPANCAANISVVASSYFDGAFYSADTCGEGAYSFLPFYIANGSIGSQCRVHSECYGEQVAPPPGEHFLAQICNRHIYVHAHNCMDMPRLLGNI